MELRVWPLIARKYRISRNIFLDRSLLLNCFCCLARLCSIFTSRCLWYCTGFFLFSKLLTSSGRLFTVNLKGNSNGRRLRPTKFIKPSEEERHCGRAIQWFSYGRKYNIGKYHYKLKKWWLYIRSELETKLFQKAFYITARVRIFWNRSFLIFQRVFLVISRNCKLLLPRQERTNSKV